MLENRIYANHTTISTFIVGFIAYADGNVPALFINIQADKCYKLAYRNALRGFLIESTVFFSKLAVSKLVFYYYVLSISIVMLKLRQFDHLDHRKPEFLLGRTQLWRPLQRFRKN